MSTQKFQNDDISVVTRDDKANDSLEEHLYEDTVFETSKKIKKESDQNQQDTGTKREVVQQKNTSPSFVDEKKHKSAINQNKQTQSLKDSVTRSREIHRRLMNKRNRWKPSELELAILKHNYDKNIYPTKEEKEGIIKSLEEKFKAKIDINQLSRWFQHEREKTTKSGSKSTSKNTYKKFAKEELEYLKTCFSEVLPQSMNLTKKNTYPKTEEMIQIGKKLGVSLSKIENWYKHNRRSLAKKGCFTLKTKKYFKKEEINYLVKMFELYPRPTKDQVTDMAKKLNCTESQIKNWYSNKRKKQKLLARRRGNSNKVDAEPDVPISIPKINQNNTSINAEHPISQIPINPLLKPIAIPISQPSQPNGLTEAEFKLQTQNILKPIIQQQLPQNANFVPAYQNMPVFIIPAAPMNNSSMTINTNTINTNTIYENQIKKTNNNFEKGHGHEERVLHPKGTNGIQTQSQNQFQAHNQFEPRHTTQTNWVSQTQTFPIQNNPVIIVSNKPMNYGNQGYMIAQNGIPMQQAQPMGGMMPFEQPPMQIQYLTSLYAPYSNNNIFSNYYPVVYQTAPNVQFQPVQQVNGELQGQMMQQQPSFQQMDLKTIPMIKPNALRRFGVPQENINDINNVNKDN